MKSAFIKFKTVVLLSLLTFQGFAIFAQCPNFPAITPDVDCSQFQRLQNNANVSTGQVFSFCGNTTNAIAFTGINLNGGTIRICANATISGNFNSGTIVVACGATLSFPNNFTLNGNMAIVNYGTVEVNGDLSFQNSNNVFYNAAPTSRLIVSGNIQTSQNANQTGYVANKGYIQVTGNLIASEGGQFCLYDGSAMVVRSLSYGQNCGGAGNRFTFADNAGAAILRYRSSATLRAALTTSNRIQVWKANGASTSTPGSCGSWGSATVVNNAAAVSDPGAQNLTLCNPQNCYTVFLLPYGLAGFTVIPQKETVLVKWKTTSETNMSTYAIERSQDGYVWGAVGSIPSQGNSNLPQKYELTDQEPVVGMAFYRLKAVDASGAETTSAVVTVEWSYSGRPSLHIFPNPASDVVTIQGSEDLTSLQIYGSNGQALFPGEIETANATYREIDLSGLPNGIYFVQTNLGTGRFVKAGAN